MNLIARLEFDLAFNDIAVMLVNHYTAGNTRQCPVYDTKLLVTAHEYTWLSISLSLKKNEKKMNLSTGKKSYIIVWIDKYPEILHPKFNKRFIIEGIEIIFDNYSFQFNNVKYIETLGTAMGTKMAPTYATLTLV